MDKESGNWIIAIEFQHGKKILSGWNINNEVQWFQGHVYYIPFEKLDLCFIYLLLDMKEDSDFNQKQ